jgi:Penicillin tolerance protein
MGEEKLPTYFVLNASRLVSATEIKHYNLHEKREVVSHFWLPNGSAVIGITAGASCPNNLIEETLIRLLNYAASRVEISSWRPDQKNCCSVRCPQRFNRREFSRVKSAADSGRYRIRRLRTRSTNAARNMLYGTSAGRAASASDWSTYRSRFIQLRGARN